MTERLDNTAPEGTPALGARLLAVYIKDVGVRARFLTANQGTIRVESQASAGAMSSGGIRESVRTTQLLPIVGTGFRAYSYHCCGPNKWPDRRRR